MTKLIFGCGYLGSRVARRWREAGHDVTVVTRGGRRAAELEQQGYHAMVADVTRPETFTNLPLAETVLFAVGFDRDAGGTIEDVYAGGMRNALAALPAETGRFVYVSTTGVYGTASGRCVDEQTPPDPERAGGRASLAAEHALAESRFATRGIILRLAGLYGPGRIPYLDSLRAGVPIPAPSEGHLNLIHVDDAATVVVAAAQLPLDDLTSQSGKPRVYCVSDGRPVQRGDYYREVARRIGAPPPRFVAPDPHSPRAARAAADRCVRNDVLLRDLKVRLAFPDYQAGLAAVLGQISSGCGPIDSPL